MAELSVEFYVGANLCWEGIRDIEKMTSEEVDALVEHAQVVRHQYCQKEESFHGYAFLNRKRTAKIFVQDGRIVLDFCKSSKEPKKNIRNSSRALSMKRRKKCKAS